MKTRVTILLALTLITGCATNNYSLTESIADARDQRVAQGGASESHNIERSDVNVGLIDGLINAIAGLIFGSND
ncbi:hypothetical protein [Paraferrimonas sedimenticola]|uniref:Lipoprotein n=1 Tax=Paraferrimonas sedimenticola TaxID=375674 RepID=A0AA37VU83_9GAMM|nr:hypothetical protein [Paraferrimonas sedimenticola]GLP95724.1 hypothetical protein GCM10007895_10300 [Paraferrimonas sedimenticola]